MFYTLLQSLSDDLNICIVIIVYSFCHLIHFYSAALYFEPSLMYLDLGLAKLRTLNQENKYFKKTIWQQVFPPPSLLLSFFLITPFNRIIVREGEDQNTDLAHHNMWSYKILYHFQNFFEACLNLFLLLMKFVTQFVAFGLEIILLLGTITFCRLWNFRYDVLSHQTMIYNLSDTLTTSYINFGTCCSSCRSSNWRSSLIVTLLWTGSVLQSS